MKRTKSSSGGRNSQILAAWIGAAGVIVAAIIGGIFVFAERSEPTASATPDPAPGIQQRAEAGDNGTAVTVAGTGNTLQIGDIVLEVAAAWSEAERRALARTLRDIQSIVAEHRWDDLVHYFDPENLAFQRELGVQMPQYIEEAFGLNTEFNRLGPGAATGPGFDRLERIRTLNIEGTSTLPGSRIEITGKFELDDSSSREARFTLQLTPDGAFQFDLPLG